MQIEYNHNISNYIFSKEILLLTYLCLCKTPAEILVKVSGKRQQTETELGKGSPHKVVKII